MNRHISGQGLIDSIESLLVDHPVFEDADVRVQRFPDSTDTRAQCLRRLANDLSPRQYEALVLRCYDEFSCKEIADILDTNEESAARLVQQGLDQLKQFAKLVMSFGLFILWSTI